MPWLLLIAGFILLVGGGEFLVRGATQLARRLGMKPLLIGLTVVAFGTSTPALAASQVAAWRGHSALVLDDIIGETIGDSTGANIFNVLAVLGATGVVHPLAVNGTHLAWRYTT